MIRHTYTWMCGWIGVWVRWLPSGTSIRGCGALGFDFCGFGWLCFMFEGFGTTPAEREVCTQAAGTQPSLGHALARSPPSRTPCRARASSPRDSAARVPRAQREYEQFYEQQQSAWGLAMPTPAAAAVGQPGTTSGTASLAPRGRGRAMIRPAWLVRREREQQQQQQPQQARVLP